MGLGAQGTAPQAAQGHHPWDREVTPSHPPPQLINRKLISPAPASC